MSVNRMIVKFYIEDAEAYEITNIIPIFHQWIRENAVPGMLIDVADYKHVTDGPGILLIGHEVDYALDEGYGRRGFITRRKRIQGGSLAENLQQTLDWAVAAARHFEVDTGLKIGADEIEITFPDRLHMPNSEETFADIQEDVTAVLQSSFGRGAVELTNNSVDERRPLSIKATIPNAPTVARLSEAAITA